MGGLCAKSSFVDCISEDAKGEYRDRKAIAAVKGIAAGKFGKSFVVVFSAGGDVPECRVEDDARSRD